MGRFLSIKLLVRVHAVQSSFANGTCAQWLISRWSHGPIFPHRRCEGKGAGSGGKGGGGKEAAAWGACVLLFTDKKDTSPLYKSLAGQYAGKVAFGEVRGANKELSDQFAVTR